MKARIKEIGTIVDIENLYDDGTALIANGGYIKVSKLEFLGCDDIDWEARRYELAKEYSKEFVRLQHYAGLSENGLSNPKVVKWSVEIADALIAELRKKQ